MSTSDAWIRLCNVDDSLEMKRIGIEKYHEQRVREWLESLVEDGDMPAEAVPVMLARAMAAIAPMVEADLVAIVGHDALN